MEKTKGVTIVETVVAMALIAIISATVFATYTFSIKNQSKYRLKQFFANETENVLMCYYSNNFSNAISLLTNEPVLKNEDLTYFNLYYDDELNYTDKSNAIFDLKIDYSEKYSPNVTVTNIFSNEVVYNYGDNNDL